VIPFFGAKNIMAQQKVPSFRQILLTQVSKSYNLGGIGVEILQDVNHGISRDKITVITGPSGSGKSTLLNIISGLETPSRGHISFDGINITKLSIIERSELRNKVISHVLQDHSLISELSVEENIKLPLTLKGLNPYEEKYCELFEQLIGFVGLEKKKSLFPGELSGGECQRVALARALMTRPPFLIADEPTGNLDEQTAEKIMQLIVKAHKEWDIGVIIATHDPLITEQATSVLKLHNHKLEQVR
jgi:ABC-type lipoprotein export system ATPase subunit